MKQKFEDGLFRMRVYYYIFARMDCHMYTIEDLFAGSKMEHFGSSAVIPRHRFAENPASLVQYRIHQQKGTRE